jgi:hypothetical protein
MAKGQTLQDPFLNKYPSQGKDSGIDLPRQRHQIAGPGGFI